MADSRIYALIANGAALNALDRLPVDRSSYTESKHITGTEIFSGVYSAANQNLFNTMLYNNNKTTYTSSFMTTGTGSNTVILLNVLDSVYTTSRYIINFKLSIVSVTRTNGTDYAETRDYNITFFKGKTSGAWATPAITQIGSSHTFNSGIISAATVDTTNNTGNYDLNFKFTTSVPSRTLVRWEYISSYAAQEI